MRARPPQFPALDAPPNTYAEVVHILERYVSRLNAQSMLDGALRQFGLTRDELSPETLKPLLRRLSRGLLLFAGDAQFEVAMDALNALVPPSDLAPRTVIVSSEADLSHVRTTAREACQKLGADPFAIQKVATIASELARNIVLYAGQGRLEFCQGDLAPASILLRASDEGPGIPNLDQIMSGRYRSRTGLGKGLLGTKRLANRFHIETGPEGTTVEAEVQV